MFEFSQIFYLYASFLNFRKNTRVNSSILIFEKKKNTENLKCAIPTIFFFNNFFRAIKIAKNGHLINLITH